MTCMTGRVIVTARCRGKGHPLVEVIPDASGLRVRIREVAVGHSKSGRVHYRPGGPAEGTLGDGTTIFTVMCKCGRPHLVRARDLAVAAATGESVAIAAPMR
jgi:hypothetical protein